MRLVFRSSFLFVLSSLGFAQEPLTRLVAAYPYGEHRCMTLTSDESRAFVGRGAVISVLDVATLPASTVLQPIQEIEVPDVGPQALAYFRHPLPDPATGAQRRWLFMAGGTLGLSRITLCDGLFQTPAVACADSSFQRTLIDRPGSDASWTWKRCVDVAIVENNAAAGRPLLFALHAASSDSAKSTIGATELRAYRLEPGGATPLYATIALPADGPSGEDAVGTALAADPQDPDHVYVALGTAWLWKVTIGAGSLVADRVPTPASVSTCSISPCPAGEAMTDIDLVRVPGFGPVVYAALEYGRVLEYRLAPSPVVKEALVSCVAPQPGGALPAYLERVTAAARSDGSVLVAVSAQDQPSRYVQTTAPFMADGIWSSICITTGVGNANTPPELSSSCREIHLLSARPAETAGPRLLREVEPYDRLWGSLILKHRASTEFRLYACSQRAGTSIFRIAAPPAIVDFDLLATWRGPVFAAADGAMSILNPGLTFHGQDGYGPYENAGELQLLQPAGSPIDFYTVQGALSACAGTAAPVQQDCGSYSAGGRNPFAGSAPGSATWRDPQNPELEWFMPGGRNALPVMNCSVVDLCGIQNPCDPTSPVRWRPLGLFTAGTDVGWDLVRMRPNPQQGQQSTGASLDMKWWQVRSPQQTAETRTESVPYVFSVADPRFVDPGPSNNDFPIPAFVHLLRGGSAHGYKVMSPAELMNRALSRCSPSRRGRGENLAPVVTDQPAFAEAVTHVELEVPAPGQDPCEIIVPCAGSGMEVGYVRNLHNNKAHVFSVVDPNGVEVWIAAVAAGFVASGPTQPGGSIVQTPGCQWAADYGRALITFYDLSGLQLAPNGGTHPPRLIRVALGPQGVQSHAFAVRTKSVGAGAQARTYAYVADLTGRLLAYDVSWAQLFLPTPPAQGAPYRPLGGAPHPVLAPIATIQFPTSAYDGLRPNCVDVEVDGNDVYCALERAGIGIVDVSVPSQPVLHTILDTPGATQGIVFRPVGQNDVQMVVGDSRAGMRLYARP